MSCCFGTTPEMCAVRDVNVSSSWTGPYESGVRFVGSKPPERRTTRSGHTRDLRMPSAPSVLRVLGQSSIRRASLKDDQPGILGSPILNRTRLQPERRRGMIQSYRRRADEQIECFTEAICFLCSLRTGFEKSL